MLIDMYKLGPLWDAIDTGEFEENSYTEIPSEWKRHTLDLDKVLSISIQKRAKYRNKINEKVREDILVIVTADLVGGHFYKTDEDTEVAYNKLIKLINEYRNLPY